MKLSLTLSIFLLFSSLIVNVSSQSSGPSWVADLQIMNHSPYFLKVTQTWLKDGSWVRLPPPIGATLQPRESNFVELESAAQPSEAYIVSMGISFFTGTFNISCSLDTMTSSWADCETDPIGSDIKIAIALNKCPYGILACNAQIVTLS